MMAEEYYLIVVGGGDDISSRRSLTFQRNILYPPSAYSSILRVEAVFCPRSQYGIHNIRYQKKVVPFKFNNSLIASNFWWSNEVALSILFTNIRIEVSAKNIK
jgi:hypothetical protein